MKTTPALLFTVWIGCFCTSRLAVAADTPLSYTAPPATEPADPLHFDPLPVPDYLVTFADDDERWSYEILGTALGDVTNRHVVMGGLTTGVGYYVLDNLAIQLDVSGYGFNEGRSSGAATGITLGLRHHIFDVGKSSVFLDVSGGEIWASNNVPYGGSHLNNTFEGGIGVATPIAKDTYLLTGVRFFHLSNANNHGDDRNPSVNAVQGVVGVMWRF
jgi:hypothetical protein